MTTILAKICLIRNEGNYILYIVENLNYNSWDNQYLLCVRYPNWEHRTLKEGETGYLTYTTIKSGEAYLSNITGNIEYYKHSHIRFDKFIEIKNNLEDNTIIM